MQVVRVIPAGRPDTFTVERYDMESGMREELEGPIGPLSVASRRRATYAKMLNLTKEETPE